MQALKKNWLIIAAGLLLVAAVVVYLVKKGKENTSGQLQPDSGTPPLPAAPAKPSAPPIVVPAVGVQFNAALLSKQLFEDLSSTYFNDEAIYKRVNGLKVEGLRQVYHDFAKNYANKLKPMASLTKALETRASYFTSAATRQLMFSIAKRLKNLNLY